MKSDYIEQREVGMAVSLKPSIQLEDSNKTNKEKHRRMLEFKFTSPNNINLLNKLIYYYELSSQKNLLENKTVYVPLGEAINKLDEMIANNPEEHEMIRKENSLLTYNKHSCEYLSKYAACPRINPVYIQSNQNLEIE